MDARHRAAVACILQSSSMLIMHIRVCVLSLPDRENFPAWYLLLAMLVVFVDNVASKKKVPCFWKFCDRLTNNNGNYCHCHLRISECQRINYDARSIFILFFLSYRWWMSNPTSPWDNISVDICDKFLAQKVDRYFRSGNFTWLTMT